MGTGGMISSLGAGPFDVQGYAATGRMTHADESIVRFPELVLACDRVIAEHPDLAGIVPGHGTASLEETAIC